MDPPPSPSRRPGPLPSATPGKPHEEDRFAVHRLLRAPRALTNDDKRLIIQKLVDPDGGITISADREVVVHWLLPVGEAAAPPTRDFVADASSATKLS